MEWTEIHCPACLPLGWDKARRLIDVQGENHVRIRCNRCKSLIQLEGTELSIIEHGLQNPQQQKAIYSEKLSDL